MATSVEPHISFPSAAETGLPVAGQAASLSPRHAGLIAVAVLGGMAAAAAFVAVHAMRQGSSNQPARRTSMHVSEHLVKPSAFGIITPVTTAPDVRMTAPQIARSGNQAVVSITGFDQNDRPISSGAGYVYSTNGMVVTSYSAIRGASSVEIESSAGEQLLVLAVMGYSAARDVAVLGIVQGNLPSLPSGADELVQEGDEVTSVGPNHAVASGVVGARRAVGGVDLIQISSHASAGWPVLNARGRVIGIATRRMIGGEELTFAVPVRYVSDVLADKRVLSFAQLLEETQQSPAGAGSK